MITFLIVLFFLRQLCPCTHTRAHSVSQRGWNRLYAVILSRTHTLPTYWHAFEICKFFHTRLTG